MAAASGAHVEALHFADILGERAHGDYAYGSLSTIRCLHPRDQKSATRWCVFAGKSGEFLLETLETEIGVDGGLVFAEEGAGDIEVVGRGGRKDGEHGEI